MNIEEKILKQENEFATDLKENHNNSFIDYLKDTYNSKETLPLNVNMFNPQPLPEKPLENIDYTTKKLSTKIKSKLSFIPAYMFYKKAKKKFKFRIDNREVFDNLKTGAVITSNHFSKYDSLPIIDCQLNMKKRRRIYKVIQEANYYMKGVIGVFMRNNYTLPLSRSNKTMRKFLKACDTILKRKELILIYPEQELWPDYQKPRPTRPGTFQIAARSNVPIIPCFTEIKNYQDKKGETKQQYVCHVLSPIEPNPDLPSRERAMDMQIRHFEALQKLYEEINQKPLTFGG